MTRARIIVFWSLFLLLCLLLRLAWSHRILWLSIFIPAWVILGLIKPPPPPMPRALKVLFVSVCIVFGLAVVVHGILYPASAELYLVSKVACWGLLVPALCGKAYFDYRQFTAVPSRSGESRSPGNRRTVRPPIASREPAVGDPGPGGTPPSHG